MKAKRKVGSLLGLSLLLCASIGLARSEAQTSKPRVRIFSDNAAHVKNVDELWVVAKAVVVAELMSSHVMTFQASTSTTGVVTVHQMWVVETIKDDTGSCQQGRAIEVVEEVGEYDVGDRILEVVPHDKVRMKVGRRALLFLQPQGARMALADSVFGAYKLDEKGRVILKRLPGEDPDVEVFLQRLRGLKKAK